MNKILMHVNFAEAGWDTFGGKTIDDICKMAAEIGYDGIEFRKDAPREYRDVSAKDYFKAMGDGMKKYGLSEITCGFDIGQCTNPDAEVRKTAIEDAIEAAKYLNDFCGTTMLNLCAHGINSPLASAAGHHEFNGSFAATEEQWKLTAESFHMLGEALIPLGMKGAFETHHYYIHDLPQAARKLVDMIDLPSVGVNMDYGNMVMCFPNKPSLEEMIDILGDKLFYVHVKNSVPMAGGYLATPLGEGEINHAAYLEKLWSVGYEGSITIETIRSGDRKWYAKQDFNYLKSLMK